MGSSQGDCLCALCAAAVQEASLSPGHIQISGQACACTVWVLRLLRRHVVSDRWGSQLELVEEFEMALFLSWPSSASSSSFVRDPEARTVASTTPSESLMLG